MKKMVRSVLLQSLACWTFVVVVDRPALAQPATPAVKSNTRKVRTLTVRDLTFDEANAKVRALVKPEKTEDKFYLKSIDAKVSRRSVKYTLTFQTYLPRTRYSLAASQAALDEAIAEAKAHGGILITDFTAYRYNRRQYYAYVSRVVAQRGSSLKFRVMPALPDSVYAETVKIQREFGRLLVRSSKYTDIKGKRFHAMLFVKRGIKLDRPNFKYRGGD